jgi:hypothetical protein
MNARRNLINQNAMRKDVLKFPQKRSPDIFELNKRAEPSVIETVLKPRHLPGNGQIDFCP